MCELCRCMLCITLPLIGPHKKVLHVITGTRIHFVFSLFSLKLNIFPFSVSILTFSTQKYFINFDTTHFFYVDIIVEKMGYIKICKILQN